MKLLYALLLLSSVYAGGKDKTGSPTLSRPTTSPTHRPTGYCGRVGLISRNILLAACYEPSDRLGPGVILVSPAVELVEKDKETYNSTKVGDPASDRYVFSLPLVNGVLQYLADNNLAMSALSCEWKQGLPEGGMEWQNQDCTLDATGVQTAGMVTCTCNHLTLFGIILRSEPLPLVLQYSVVPFYGVAAIGVIIQLFRIASASCLTQKCMGTPAPVLSIQHLIMLVIIGLRIWFVMSTKQTVWSPAVTVVLGVLPSLLLEILVLHVVGYWAHILAFPMQKDRWASLRFPFGLLAFVLLLVGAGLGVAVELQPGNVVVEIGNIVFAVVSALTFVVVLISGRGIVLLLEGPDTALRVRYGQVTVGLCLALFFQAVSLVVSVELPELFIPATAVFYAWDIISLGCLALLYARGVAALQRRADLRSSLQDGDYKPLKPSIRSGGGTGRKQPTHQ